MNDEGKPLCSFMLKPTIAQTCGFENQLINHSESVCFTTDIVALTKLIFDFGFY